jgi:hypothetical protein
MPRALELVLSRSLAELPPANSDFAAKWVIDDPKRLSCGVPDRGSTHEATAYVPAANLLRKHAPWVGHETFAAIEKSVLAYVPAYELWDFKYRHRLFMEQPKGWLYSRALFVAQYVLLSALPKERLSDTALAKLGVLERKLGPVDPIMKRQRTGTGGWVGSTIPQEKVCLISDRQWIEIVSRNWSDRPRRWVQLTKDSVGEVSVRALATELGRVARLQPRRIANLAMRFPLDINSAYVESILRAFAETDPPEKACPDWAPASTGAIEAILLRFGHYLNESSIANAFCWGLRKRSQEEWSNLTLQHLLELGRKHYDPARLEFTVHQMIGKESIPDPVSTSINCVRGAAASVLSEFLYTRVTRLPLFQQAIGTLIQDPHVAVRISSVGLAVPVLNLDRALAMQIFLKACDHPDDQVLRSDHTDYYLRYALFDDPERLCPLIRRMLDCNIEEVAERGANWVAEAFTHKKQWGDLFAKAAAGTPAHRCGVLGSVMRAMLDDRGGEAVLNLYIKYFDDESKKVRDKAASIFRSDKFFKHTLAVSISEAFTKSSAFGENIDDFLYGIQDEAIPLKPFAPTLKAISELLPSPASAGQRFTDTGLLATLLLRLYEQAEGDVECRKICLDAWDKLLQQQGWGVLDKLDQ